MRALFGYRAGNLTSITFQEISETEGLLAGGKKTSCFSRCLTIWKGSRWASERRGWKWICFSGISVTLPSRYRFLRRLRPGQLILFSVSSGEGRPFCCSRPVFLPSLDVERVDMVTCSEPKTKKKTEEEEAGCFLQNAFLFLSSSFISVALLQMYVSLPEKCLLRWF